MKRRTNTFVSVILLIVYGTLTFVTVPLHFHEDPLFANGRGGQTIGQHDDALHCKHRIIEVHVDCTICTFVSHSSVTKVITVIPQISPKLVEYVSTFLLTVKQDPYSSHSRRGPPVNLV
jgi:hypothetical protein